MTEEIFDTTEEYEKIIPERCTFDEHIAIQRYFHAVQLKKNIICTVVLFSLAILLYFLKAEFYIIAMALFAACVMLGQIYNTTACIKKNAKSMFDRDTQFRIEWHVYSDRLVYKAFRGETEEISYCIEPKKINRIKCLDSIYVFYYMQSVFAVSKSIVTKETPFFNMLFPSGEANDKKPLSDTFGFWYDCFAIMTWVYVAVAIYTFVPDASLWWVALIGLPFPIAMIAVWVIARHIGAKINTKIFDLAWAIVIVALSIYSLIV